MNKRHAKIIATAMMLIFVLTACGQAAPDPSQTDSSMKTGTEAETKGTELPATSTFEPLGDLVLTVDKPYVSENDKVVFSVQIGQETSLQAPLELLRDGEKIGELADEGANGDEEKGDGVYSLLLEKPVQNSKAASFSARYGEQLSESLSVNLFTQPTEEEIKKTQEALGSLRKELGEITVQDWTDEKKHEIDDQLKKLQDEGLLRLYTVDDDGFYAKMECGLGIIFDPASEGTQSSGAGSEVQICIYEATDFGKEYPNEPAENIDGLLPNYKLGKVYRDSDCSREAIENIKANQMILWNGHGTYKNSTGPCLMLGEEFSWELFITDAEYYLACISDMMLNDVGYWLFTENSGRELWNYQNGNLWIAPTYIYMHCGDISGSFIFLSACYSAKTELLASSFIAKGATAVFGYTDEVLVKYSGPLESKIFQKLTEVDQKTNDFYTLKEAVAFAAKECGASDKAAGGKGAAPKIIGGSAAENYRIAKAGAVSGIITDQDGKTIKGAEISFKRSDGKTDYPISSQPASDQSGKYEVWLPPTEFVLQVKADGYETYSEEISISDGEKLEKNIKLAEVKKGEWINTNTFSLFCPDGWTATKEYDDTLGDKVFFQDAKQSAFWEVSLDPDNYWGMFAGTGMSYASNYKEIEIIHLDNVYYHGMIFDFEQDDWRSVIDLSVDYNGVRFLVVGAIQGSSSDALAALNDKNFVAILNSLKTN